MFTHLVKCFLKGGKETNASNVCLFITTGADAEMTVWGTSPAKLLFSKKEPKELFQVKSDSCGCHLTPLPVRRQDCVCCMHFAQLAFYFECTAPITRTEQLFRDGVAEMALYNKWMHECISYAYKRNLC